jgi:site-specific DNA recombinase
MATKVIGYVRVSTAEQAASGLSLAAQRERIELFCRLHELDLVAVVEDAGASAKTLSRPGLRSVLELLRSGAADGLVVAKLDRLTRSVRDLGHLVEEHFGNGGAALLSVGEQVDTRTAAGRLVLNVLGSVSQWEREAISERTREALRQVRARGIRLGSEGLGWSRVEGKVQVVKAEAATVGRIHALRAEGATLRRIAEVLTAEGHRTKRGGRWQAQTVARVLERGEAA